MKVRKAILLLLVFLFNIPVLAQVDTAWVRRFNGSWNNNDVANALGVDNQGNVYVTGYVSRVGLISGITTDYATIKYDSKGNLLWVKYYNGTGKLWDEAYDLVVDDSGYVYVTGKSYSGLTSFDYTTIKYNTSGDTVWVRHYNGPGDSDDIPHSLIIDKSGNVYVTGASTGAGTNFDYATVKYTSDGEVLWVSRYNGIGNPRDEAFAIGVDENMNVYVTGFTFSETLSNYLTIKYTPDGETLWTRQYFGQWNKGGKAYDLAIGENGNVYVVGTTVGSGTYLDYATIKYGPNGDTVWGRVYNGPGNSFDDSWIVKLDLEENVYVTGRSFGAIAGEIATLKYNSQGDTLWVRRYNGPGNYDGLPRALVIDDSGNVYVTGRTYVTNISYDYCTIKYSSQGDLQWVKLYNGSGNSVDEARALEVDDQGSIYVSGGSGGSGTGLDYLTVKYVQFVCSAKPGDTNDDNEILLSDIITLINFLFQSQLTPNPLCRGDVNVDGKILLTDIV